MAKTGNPTELDYKLLGYSKIRRFGHGFLRFLIKIPGGLWKFIKAIAIFIKNLVVGIAKFIKDVIMTFVKGSWKTRLTYLVMGFGNLAHKQFLRGLLFLAFEAAFIFYMIFAGGYWLSKIGTLGDVSTHRVLDEELGVYVIQYGDNSFKILLYGVLTMFFIVALAFTWWLSVKQSRTLDELDKDKKRIASDKDDIAGLVDENFHRTMLSLPLIGIVVFTVIPIIFMILVAFTNFDLNHNPPMNRFGWVGWDNFGQLFTWGGSKFSATFGEILVWTLIWAFFATFTNYFLGMLVALLINKKGIVFKKGWRTILVLTVTIPQFISLLYISKMFGENGIINNLLSSWGWIKSPILFWKDPTLAKITVIVINIWIGIPYLMLMVTGILMNIPADLYESAKIDGASPMQQYMKITLPYMLFVTGPYLLTSFTGNMNNFNVIYLLTGGGPANINLYKAAGQTNLLITWLYATTVTNNQYNLAAVIGIMVFIVVALISLVVYNLLPSNRNEEDLA